jgi:putative acetyltransferase
MRSGSPARRRRRTTQQMTLAVAQETADAADVRELLRLSDEFSQSLYPPESRHPLEREAIGAPHVRFFVARLDGTAVGCGALVLGDHGRAELRRMFVHRRVRGQGIGTALLRALEDAAAETGVTRLQLETGVDNHDALTLYRRNGYHERGPFGAYTADPVSVFMEKTLTS